LNMTLNWRSKRCGRPTKSAAANRPRPTKPRTASFIWIRCSLRKCRVFSRAWKRS